MSTGMVKLCSVTGSVGVMLPYSAMKLSENRTEMTLDFVYTTWTRPSLRGRSDVLTTDASGDRQPKPEAGRQASLHHSRLCLLALQWVRADPAQASPVSPLYCRRCPRRGAPYRSHGAVSACSARRLADESERVDVVVCRLLRGWCDVAGSRVVTCHVTWWGPVWNYAVNDKRQVLSRLR